MKSTTIKNHFAINLNVNTGFTIVELAVVMVTIGVLSFALMPAFVNALAGANMTALGSKGRDIFVSITSANSERKAIHGLPVWPDRGEFTNSTDFFRHLFDEENYGTPAWKPKVEGFDYSKLSGAGVPLCDNNRLTPEYNAWSVAEQLTEDWDESMPVLVTRNVDASSLASPDTMTNGHWTLRFDSTWDTPFGSGAMIIIRKSGAILKCRAKNLSYANFYKNAKPIFPCAGNGALNVLATSFSYLTPTGRVSPGSESYTAGHDQHTQQKRRSGWRLFKDIKAFKALAPTTSIGWGAGYLIVFLVCSVVCWHKCKVSQLSISRALFAAVHYCVTVLYSTALASYVDINRRWWPIYVFALAVLIQLGMVIWMATKGKQKGRLTGLVFALSPPLIVCGIFWFLIILAMVTM